MTYPRAGSLEPYELASIKACAAPRGTEGKDWWRYVITQGSNIIYGRRRGTRDDVTRAVEDWVTLLNHRLKGNRGRVHLVHRGRPKPGGSE